MGEAKLYSLTEAAEMIGIAPITLKRWLLASKVDEVIRDRNNWRRFTDADVRGIKEFANRMTPPKVKRR
jgi:predicted site-specific integrase-resolvase